MRKVQRYNRISRKKRKLILASGGKFDFSGLIPIAQTAGGLADSVSETPTGRVNVMGKTAGGLLKGAATGAGLGSVAGPIGTAIGAIGGAIVGGVTSAVGAAKRNKEVAQQKQAEEDRKLAQQEEYSRSVLNIYPTMGIKNAQFHYAYGGKLYAYGGNVAGPPLYTQHRYSTPKTQYANGGQIPQPQGQGQMQPIAQGVAQAQGPSHGQGGIDMGTAEVEGGEVLQDTGANSMNVFSDRIEYQGGQTYAQAAKVIAEQKGKLEEGLSSTSVFARGTAKRQAEILDGKLKQLFASQQARKKELGIPEPQEQEQEVVPPNPYTQGTTPQQQMNQPQVEAPNIQPEQQMPMEQTAQPAMGYGGNMKKKAAYGDVIGKALPYVSNLGNALLTMKTPKIPDPIMDKAQPMKTTYNINPQLAESRRQQQDLQSNLKSNVSNTTTLRNNMIASKLMNVQQTNKLYGEKENIETQLKNQDAMNVQQIALGNTAKENQYEQQKMHRIDDIHQRVSANLADISNKIQYQIAEDNLKKRDKLELAIVAEKYKESGVWSRNIQKAFDDYENGDTTYEEFVAELARKDPEKMAKRQGRKVTRVNQRKQNKFLRNSRRNVDELNPAFGFTG